MFELIEGGLQNSIPFSATFERKVNKSVPLELHICQMVPLFWCEIMVSKCLFFLELTLECSVALFFNR